ncbi:MAG: O-antigen ligase family protein [Synechococcales bacterium]|nr:O-antigen ligase family protein [Synechococcales bacterium]
MLLPDQQPLSIAGWIAGLASIVLAIPLVFSLHIHAALPLVLLGLVGFCLFFFLKPEQAVMSLLILRSGIDIFSAQQVPALFAIGLDGLAIAYIALMLATRQRVHTDRFFWFFAVWMALQSLWVVLLPLGGLGLGAGHTVTSLREWIRLFSWLMVYLIVLQMRGKIHPQTVVNTLFLSLVLPLSVAMLQVCLPASALPGFLAHRGTAFTDIEGASRVNGTLGHPNALATFLVLFLGLTYWQIGRSQRRWPWLIVMGLIVFFIINTKALVGLIMMGVLIISLILPRLTVPKLVGGILLMALVVVLFGSTEFGRERLHLFTQMPFFNENLDVSRAILMRQYINNSFYWRLEQWTMLLDAWREHPWLGYGFGSASKLTYLENAAHNDYIRALVDGGIVGLVAFLGFLVGAAVHLVMQCCSQLSTRPQVDLCLTLIAVLLAMLVGMITENIWSHTALFFYWLTLIAITGWNWRSPVENHIES